MVYDKICEVCGKPFQAEKKWKKLCIGKRGLVVRDDECEEVNDKEVSV